jgi:hypothetical protein
MVDMGDDRDVPQLHSSELRLSEEKAWRSEIMPDCRVDFGRMESLSG